jgi:hypothetical protein
VARGSIAANGIVLEQGDGVAISELNDLTIESVDGGEFLLFDLN